MFIHERELKNFTHAFDFQSAYWWLSSWMSHDCRMIVIHFRLVILEGWNIPHEFQLVSILLDVYGMSFMFWLVLVDCVGWLVSQVEYIEMEENSMCFDEAQDATAAWRAKRFCCPYFQSCLIHFQDWCFSWLVTRCSRKFCSHWRAECWRQRVQ